MRAPSDMPRRVPRASNRGRVLLVVAVIVLFVLITSLRGIASFYTDYLWFDSLGQGDVWTSILGAKVALVLIFTGGFFVLLWTNLYIADRLAPPFRPAGPEEELIERYHEVIGGRTGLVRTIIALVLALIAGAGVSSEWQSWLLFVNGGDFGIEDPQFHRDIGWYVFKLPFLSFLTTWLFAAMLIVLIVTAVAHYLNGGIRVQTQRQRVTPQVKAHLSVLLGALALIKAADYFLIQRYELTMSTNGVVDGAAYTEVNAQLPVLYVLAAISVTAFVLFIVNIFRRGWVLPVVAVGLWALVAVVAGGIYPQVIQRFVVQPDEPSKERAYIDRNIDATREAQGLDVTVENLEPLADKSQVDLRDNQDTVRNIRLWDPSGQVSGKTFQQLQGIRGYYRMSDVDVDRYVIDGQQTQVSIAVRDLRSDGIPADSWVARHVNYTHGYGVALAPSAASTSSDEPNFLVHDVPVQADASVLEIENPRVYFGEGLTGYVVVTPGEEQEIDYQDADTTRRTAYEGDDGVALNSPLRRAAFALRFGDINPLISDFVKDDTRVLLIRDIRDRAEMLAPFLHFDHDPYPVIHGGRITWILDAYTTTDRYPYAQRADTVGLSSGSGLDHRFNYVRNSVKAVIDSYDGSVDFYVIDDEDPIINAYRKAFPSLFKDGDEMPDDLRDHLRYPEDLFRVQTTTWGRYHLSDPDDFYNRDDRWSVAPDPGTAGVEAGTAATDEQGNTTETQSARIQPYYQLLQLPGEEAAEFVLLRPFIPFSENDERQQLTAFMAARNDPEHYGELVVYEMPSGNLPDGPGIVTAAIQSTEQVSAQETLLGSPDTGSKVLYGNLLLLPVDDVLLYVQPFYVEARSEQRQIPQLRKVIAVFGDEVVIENTLGEALTALFGEELVTPDQTSPEDPADGEPGEEPTEPEGSPEEQALALLEEADALFAEAQEALDAGDLGEFQDKNEEAEDTFREALSLLQGTTPSTTDQPGATTSTTEEASA
jgi:uncharacterized membrane protein (UPF0182 family)